MVLAPLALATLVQDEPANSLRTCNKMQKANSPTPVMKFDGAIGELCIRGPGVMKGYCGSDDSYISTCDGQYFRTKDVVKVCETRGGGRAIKFAGRSDSMVKVGAEFVNLADVERNLEALQVDGLRACVLPSSRRSAVAHAFVASCRPEASSAEVAV